MEFYSYRLFQRPTEYSTILRAGKLFQEFIVDAWAATEQNRLTYYRLNQDKFRIELYQDLTDVSVDGVGSNQVGKRFILPSSFPGSPRHMFKNFQDSMTITRDNKHPDVFLTMTANPNWPEILSALLPNQKPTDRPDLIAHVFELKMSHLLKHSDKIQTTAQIDRYVCAEFSDPHDDPLLFQTIISCMVHGPCGARNPKAPCMEKGSCTKRYPKAFSETTTMDENSYPIYRRRNDGRVYTLKNGRKVDNRDVVPYNAYLSKMFNCHINVEVCDGLRCVKYIHKYIYKENDRTTIVLGSQDEIQQYLDSRYIGPPEAAWRIFGHLLHEEYPFVIRLVLHLPGMHQVVFNPAEPMSQILSRAEHQVTMLTIFFACCASNETARQYTYQEFPQYFVWNKPIKKWTPRQKQFAIGRMYFVSPYSGEIFYLWLLLTVVRRPTSFENLKTINNVLHDTFKAVCVARGLLEDDDEWIQCLQEAAIMRTGNQLRRLFSSILTQCSPLNPYSLWNQFSTSICDDLPHKIRTVFGIPNPMEHQIEDYGLYLLNQLLEESGKSLKDFPPFPLPRGTWSVTVENRLLWEHQQLQYEAQQQNPQDNVNRLNEEQHFAYMSITNSVFENKGTTFFLNGGAGTGKTFLYNTVTVKCRSLGHIVVIVASSGIASLLLVGGRTAHSTFTIPLDILENSICGFKK